MGCGKLSKFQENLNQKNKVVKFKILKVHGITPSIETESRKTVTINDDNKKIKVLGTVTAEGSVDIHISASLIDMRNKTRYLDGGQLELKNMSGTNDFTFEIPQILTPSEYVFNMRAGPNPDEIIGDEIFIIVTPHSSAASGHPNDFYSGLDRLLEIFDKREVNDAIAHDFAAILKALVGNRDKDLGIDERLFFEQVISSLKKNDVEEALACLYRWRDTSGEVHNVNPAVIGKVIVFVEKIQRKEQRW